jgi:glycerophosphoryl diester phosphodiesterase
MTDGLMARTWGDFRFHWRKSLGFHLLMQVLGFALLVPLVTWVARRIVLASGEPVISNFDIAAFVLSPGGAVFVLVVAALVVALLLAEFTGQGWIAGHAVARRPVTIASTIAFLVRKLPWLFVLSTRVFLRLVLLALPFLAGAALVWFTMLRGHDINYYLAEHPPEWQRAKVLVILLGAAYALVAAWQLARWIYAIPILTFQGTRPLEALRKSADMTRGRLGRIVPPPVLWWLLLTLAAAAITWASRPVSEAGLAWAGIDVHRVLPLVALYFSVTLVGGFIYSALHLAGQQFLVTRMYAEQVDAARWRVPATLEIGEQLARPMARRVILAALALLLVSLAGAWYLASRLELEGKVAVTAHRGAKVSAPENTMAAFRAAMEAGADYIELDVQRTRDGEIVVLHDADFMRMGGDPRKIAALTGAEVATIDIGRKYDAAFTGEHAPTLEEVIDLVRGQMKINIELKYNVPDSTLAPAVIDLLRRKNFLDQVVITSLDYNALKQVERIEPGIQTGHIVTASVGNVVQTQADFLSLNSAKATPQLIRQAHAAGKEVHVWTVNEPEVMQLMIERGVDNIITDDPVTLERVLKERQTLSRPELLGLRLRVLYGKPPQEVTNPAAVEVL